MKMLILFSGFSGMSINFPSAWDITCVELNDELADICRQLHPTYNVITLNAIQFLENNDINVYDIVFSTPPCTTHSIMNRFNDKKKIPDLTTLYGVKIFMDYHYPETSYIIENTSSWYSKPIKPTVKLGRHYIWSNFRIRERGFEITDIRQLSKNQLLKKYGLPILKIKGNAVQQRQKARNILEPWIADYIMSEFLRSETVTKLGDYFD